MATQEEDQAARQAEVDALVARYEDPNDPYDAHHGTDRSEDSLAWAKEHDPETYERVMAKIAAAGGVS